MCACFKLNVSVVLNKFVMLSSAFMIVFCRIMADTRGLHKEWYSILGACPTDDIQELKQKYQKLILMVGAQQMFPCISGSQPGGWSH